MNGNPAAVARYRRWARQRVQLRPWRRINPSLNQKHVNAEGDVTTIGAPAVAVLFTTTRLEPTWTTWRGGVSPLPTTGTVATVVGTHVVTPLFTGTTSGADEGPTVR